MTQPIRIHNDPGVILELLNLRTVFETRGGTVRAVNGISFYTRNDTVLGVVGESGCGKTVMAHSILRTVDPMGGKVADGNIFFRRKNGEVVDIASLPSEGRQLRSLRGSEISMIFQEPMTAFSPVYTIGQQIMEVITLHQKIPSRQAKAKAIEMLGRVSIPKPEVRVDAYPHQLSGGMRQRAMIAMALSCQPKLLIADEPTTALDVTIQAQILELMVALQREFEMNIIMITHDLGVIAELATDVVVMYLGSIVEKAPVGEVYSNPKHPYTKALQESIPRVEGSVSKKLATISGSVPSAKNIPPGCPFHPRCREFMQGQCDVHVPTLETLSADHTVACWLYGGGE